jgi:hypothetical protein
LFLYSAMSTVTAISFKPKATRKRLKKEILSDDFKKRKIFRENIAENFPPHITRCVQCVSIGCLMYHQFADSDHYRYWRWQPSEVLHNVWWSSKQETLKRDCTAKYSRRLLSSHSPPWEPEISTPGLFSYGWKTIFCNKQTAFGFLLATD